MSEVLHRELADVRAFISQLRPPILTDLGLDGAIRDTAEQVGAILGITLLRAASLGTEFVPKLSEGDIVLGIIRAPGTSIEESCRMNMRIEKALLEEFPAEIAHVWSRVGTPEVATDAGAIGSEKLSTMRSSGIASVSLCGRLGSTETATSLPPCSRMTWSSAASIATSR